MYPIRFGEVRERPYKSSNPINYAAVGQRGSNTPMFFDSFEGKEAELLSQIEALYRTPIGAIKDFPEISSRNKFVYGLSQILEKTGVFQTPIQPFLKSFPDKERAIILREIERGLQHNDRHADHHAVSSEDKLTLEDAMRAFMVNSDIHSFVFLNLLMSCVISNLTNGLQVNFPLIHNFCSFVNTSALQKQPLLTAAAAPSPSPRVEPKGDVSKKALVLSDQSEKPTDEFRDSNGPLDTVYEC